MFFLPLWGEPVLAQDPSPSPEAGPAAPETQPSPPADPPPADLPPPLPPPPAPPAVQSFPGLLNPSISVNGLIVGALTIDDGEIAPPGIISHEHGEETGEAEEFHGETFGTGLFLQETELRLAAAVDPYFKGDFTLAMHGIEGVEIEEGYVQMVAVPRLTLSIGKFKEPFGRENLAHTHALLTIDRSLVGQRLLGDEGLNDVALSAALLLPTPWFSELSLVGDAGNNEVLYGSGLPEGFGAMAHWKNLVDLSYETTLELGVSGATGLDAAGGRTVLAGADLTLRSHGRGKRQHNKLIWQTEYLWLKDDVGGLYSTLEYALTRRFWAGGRFDLVGFPGEAADRVYGGTLLLAFVPTEFSAIRLQGQRQFLADEVVDSVVAQLNFTLGAHPAHAY